VPESGYNIAQRSEWQRACAWGAKPIAVNTIQVQRRLITVDRFEQRVRSGVFPEDDRLELIEGELVAMSPIGSQHAAQVTRLTQILTERLGRRALVSVQNLVRLAHSELQPDLLFLRPQADYCAADLPGPGDVLLIAEVADTAAVFERCVNVPLHPRSGIAETWLIDLADNTVEVYSVPAAGGYRHKQTLGMGDSVACLAFPDLGLAAADLFEAKA
jgi:Uma2 family endonuclease